MTYRTRNEGMTGALIAGATSIAAAALFAAGPTASFAQTPHASPEARVSYADLDLTRPEGVETLRARVESAARIVCGRRNAATMKEIARSRECFEDAVAQAMGQVELPVAAELRWTVSIARDAT